MLVNDIIHWVITPSVSSTLRLSISESHICTERFTRRAGVQHWGRRWMRLFQLDRCPCYINKKLKARLPPAAHRAGSSRQGDGLAVLLFSFFYIFKYSCCLLESIRRDINRGFVSVKFILNKLKTNERTMAPEEKLTKNLNLAMRNLWKSACSGKINDDYGLWNIPNTFGNIIK